MGVAWTMFGFMFGFVAAAFTSLDLDRTKKAVIISICSYFALSVFNYAVNFSQMFYCQKGIKSVEKNMRMTLLNSLLTKDIAFFEDPNNSPGDLSALLSSSIPKMANLIGPPLFSVLQTCFALITSISLSFGYSWQISLICVSVGLCPQMMADMHVRRFPAYQCSGCAQGN